MDELSNSPDGCDCFLISRFNNSDDFMLLALMVGTLTKTWDNHIHVYFPYMGYQQADRDFSEGESFSLKTITSILNGLPIESFKIYDPHSDVSEGLLHHAYREDNSEFIKGVFNLVNLKYRSAVEEYESGQHPKNLVILSPDAGAYKKIFKLAEKIGFKGPIETANKYRDVTNGDLQVRLSKEDFEGQDILIIDDICIGGRTFIALAEELRKRNAGKLFLAVSHGIFSNGLLELGRYFSDIFTTNSRRDEYEVMIEQVQDAQVALELLGPADGGFCYKNQPFQLHVFEII